jgi:indolepyruvate ferredoxin oxidoreductase
MLGYAWQKGMVPVGLAAMLRAIELNNVAVDLNKKAFTVGRLHAADPGAIASLLSPAASVIQFTAPSSLEQTIAFRVDWLTKYQNGAYAERYLTAVRKVQARERLIDGDGAKFAVAKAVARYLFKVMAFKDEYEVARLHADPAFRQQIAAQFDGHYRLEFHLAAPLVSKKTPGSGIPSKRRFGGWMMNVFRLLAQLKFLRDTPCDVFGYTRERAQERRLRTEYFELTEMLAESLTRENRAVALKLAQLPEKIRGYGHVKLAAIAHAGELRNALMDEYRQRPGVTVLMRRS